LNNEHFAAEAWPIMDSINIFDTIVVQVYLGMNYDVSDLNLDVSKDGKKMVVSSVGPVPFKKQFLFPTEVRHETAKAVISEGILRVKFQKATA
jgi:HSP20 family molecular chaperone IbpA